LQSVDLGRAAELLDEARSLRGYDVQVDRLRAWLDELRGDPAAAAADYARVLAATPDPEVRLRRANLLLRVNRIDEALAEYERVAAERPTDRGTRVTLADIYEFRDRLADAEQMLIEIEHLAPGELGPLKRLAAFYRRTGQHAKAADVESRVRALEVPPRVLRPLRPSVR
jgi:tetratricopeptide (TPR) repeat protein